MAEDERTWYARPVFFVRDCEAALRFYAAIGFSEAWRHEEEARLVAVQVDLRGVELILNESADRAGGGRLFLSLERGEVARVAASWGAAGIALEDGFWGMPVKSVRDPDGNELLLFDDDLVEDQA